MAHARALVHNLLYPAFLGTFVLSLLQRLDALPPLAVTMAVALLLYFAGFFAEGEVRGQQGASVTSLGVSVLEIFVMFLLFTLLDVLHLGWGMHKHIENAVLRGHSPQQISEITMLVERGTPAFVLFLIGWFHALHAAWIRRRYLPPQAFAGDSPRTRARGIFQRYYTYEVSFVVMLIILAPAVLATGALIGEFRDSPELWDWVSTLSWCAAATLCLCAAMNLIFFVRWKQGAQTA